jgi:oxygen-independent coproporphyrinogen-3 oxidase
MSTCVDLPVTIQAGFAVYIHWPFCLSKCPYCDFNSHVAAGPDQARWRAAYLRELDHLAGLGGRETVQSVFFGGGTPSLMAPETVAALLERIAHHWPVADDLEVTLEANPGAVDAARFRGFRDAGVNRLSIGVQSLDDSALRFLGRRHDRAEALAAIEMARKTFPRISFDLIYARPGQTAAAWTAELRQAIALAADHLSLYQLTIEPGTAFHPLHARGAFVLPEDDDAVALYELTQELCDAAGLPAYEVSNHAAAGAECRHNLIYWRGGSWAGVGPGAHGRLALPGGMTTLSQHKAPAAWLDAVERDGHGTAESTVLSAGERIEEVLMMGLRLTEGVDATRFRAQTGKTLEQAVDAEELAVMVEDGFLVHDREGLRATSQGRLVLNAVLGRLLR